MIQSRTIEVPTSRPGGVWALADGRLIIADAAGPATILLPSEAVLLLPVDLPLPTRARRLEALPFAVEGRIAEPLESVHVALGAAIGDKRYLAAVVRHDRMAAWVALAEDAGLAHAAMIPDCLALPEPPPGHWTVELRAGRALVRASDATGFAVPEALLRTAWEKAGRPPAHGLGEPLPEGMQADGPALPVPPLADRVAEAPLDLRQGRYARRIARPPRLGRRLGWVLGIGAAAHAVIAMADAVMLRAIAERRAEETRALIAAAAPGMATDGGDLAGTVADMLPQPGASSAFLPLLTRVSGALAPVATDVAVRSMRFRGNMLVIDMEGRPDLAARIPAAMRDSGLDATLTNAADGSLRLTVRA